MLAKEPPSKRNFGLQIQRNGIAVAQVDFSQSTPELLLCDFIQCPTPEGIIHALSHFVEEHQIERQECVWVLGNDDYKLSLMDPLPVTPEELPNALRWRIKSFIDFPLEDANIESFTVPAKGAQKLYVAVSRISALHPIVQLINAAHLYLEAIDIPDLALRNINALFPDDNRGLALLLLRPEGAQLFITFEKNLFLSRNISLSLASLFKQTEGQMSDADKTLLDTLALEIQRSFDYYQSQLRQPPVSKLLVDYPMNASFAYFASQFTCKVEALDINKALHYKGVLTPEMQSQCLAAIGGALRREES